MKSLYTFHIAFGLVSFATSAYSQDNPGVTDIKIDPRQYVTVQYKKIRTQGRLDTAWNWEERKNVPNQKINFIDVDGELKIDFSRLGLISNKDFEGTVSLEAEISGVSGTRKIEVNPYSEVGVQRIPIGIKSEPPSDIAKKLLNMIRELKEAEDKYNFISIYGSFTQNDVDKRKVILTKTKSVFDAIDSPTSKLEDLIPDALDLEKLIFNKNLNNLEKAKTKKELKGGVVEFLRIYDENYDDSRRTFINLFSQSLEYTSGKVDIILSYLNSFEGGGEDATKAFLSLINKDLVGYKVIKNTFVNAQKKLAVININYKANDPKVDSVLLANAALISGTCKSLAEISRFKGSQLESIITDLAKRKNMPFIKSNNSLRLQDEERLFYFTIIDQYFQELSENLSLAAGRMIYKKLISAMIDLGKSGAKNGEVLSVYVTWILDSKRDSLSNSPRLPIGKYFLRETGWRMEVADMFALIKRIDESKVDPATVSPSNFKGSGGAVLMWTFNKLDRGVKITKQDGEFRVTDKNRFINFLEPSIGFNVSYLDFSTEKDVEIGTGLQLGLFKNKIFAGYGLNLHMISPNQSPTYFYLGFSFARLSDLFKDSNSVSAIK
jgi:hypothetical protein